MTTAMGPPPSRNPATDPSSAAADEPSTSESTKVTTAMPPPPPRNPNPSEPEGEPEPSENHKEEPKTDPPCTDTSENPTQLSNSTDNSDNVTSAEVEKKKEQRNNNAAVPYAIPAWSGAPVHHFFLEVLKDGSIIDQYDVNKKGAYMFGRVDICDFVLEHPTISRFHAVLQFRSDGGAYLYDLGSTHGTFINKKQVKKRVYVDLHVGDVIRFGSSSRLYIFQGPPDLMPLEADLKSLRKAKIQQEMQDMEESLLRAKLEASSADGISWGMREDAIEETEDDVDEITWQTYKGQLTEKQEKTRDKVIKRLEKIGHMKKEIDAIRAKDIAQGGLTQGQQTQIARNEQRISQLMEELENLEETLNESIRESIGARAGKLSLGKKKGTMEDDDEDYLSDDDEFYDRTQKTSKRKSGESQVETADSLLDKRDALIKQIGGKEKSLLEEDKPAQTDEAAESGDALDAFMSAVSSQIVLDNKEKLRKEISDLRFELDRILYLLKIADPSGEATRKRESEGPKPNTVMTKKPASDAGNRPSPGKNKNISSSLEKSQKPEGSFAEPNQEKAIPGAKSESDAKREEPESATDATTVYTVSKPQWLGAVNDRKNEEIKQEVAADMQETDQFVDYKDRGKILNKTDYLQGGNGIEDAAPGLIIRRRKQVEKSSVDEVKDSGQTTGSGFKAEDAVALLLKHSRGVHASDEEDRPMDEGIIHENQGRKDRKKAKRVLGPERPPFLNDPDYSTWVPPEGQSGDGRTSLNDRLGY
ncbi:Anion exchanger adaptor protein Kanadaptin, contains FHA domain [Handroanthus impetiginosus]|uniref:Anion exchanger adaptor protein Kanadaptin, contains FHA domain n=1 Tax=Handroanthus impetiginosus TaxID=429701 RepID=A0A2G9G457_9LAMI|nr:Anion exchanger adaptor protein Kanadaptin, contains FHA domain [Handroanthus impetiginosus]